MNRDWLWDKKLSILEAKKILKDPRHKGFITLASLLFARKNEPQKVFKKYIDPLLFCKYWPEIKKDMRKDKWNSQRIIFWQAIYDRLYKMYRAKGVKFKERSQKVRDDLCKEVGDKICQIRKKRNLSQKELAQKLGISQQLISRIEGGRENVSLITLKNILKVLDKKVKINFC